MTSDSLSAVSSSPTLDAAALVGRRIAIAGHIVGPTDDGVRLVDGNDLFDLVEAQRIEHAYAFWLNGS